MLNFKDIDWKKGGIFAAGVLFGTAGIKALSSDDAKNVYTSCTAAVLRAKSCVMKTVAAVSYTHLDVYKRQAVPPAGAAYLPDYCRAS